MDSKLIAILAAVLFATSSVMNVTSDASELQSNFAAFKQTHGKAYETAEEEVYRLAVFAANVETIKEQNNKNEGAVLGQTKFADLTFAEFEAQYLTYKNTKTASSSVYSETSFVGDVNWVDAGKVQAVKDQGSCGSCWAFSAIGSLESLKAINGGELGLFSEQQLVDCSKEGGNAGCNGGLMDSAFEHMQSAGICTEDSYPYTGRDGTCQEDSCTKDSFTITGYTDVEAKSVDSLKSACDKQPVSVAVGAGLFWQLYFGGIMKPSQCNTNLNHGVLLAGYTDTYWLVKNSWGASWGESGYIRLEAPSDTCGLADQASFPK